jgi:nitrite reductase/ring-hydroxylating ferredoxin subunit
MASETSSVVVARVGELQPGYTKKFFLTIDGREEECFLVNHGGRFYAYVNRCCHIPISLDWVENQLMTEDRQHIQCATHGAQYLPDTGECIWGPPCGKFLIPVSLTICDDEVIAGSVDG